MTAPTFEQIIQDPAASHWLKKAVRQSLDRDPVDVANDAEILAAWAKERASARPAFNFTDSPDLDPVPSGFQPEPLRNDVPTKR